MDDQLLDSEHFQEQGSNNRRRDLLPIWIKIFLWLFLVISFFAPVSLVMGIFGITWELSLYGFETHEPFSFIGLLLIALISFKGITAFGLWTGKDWAVRFAIIDAIFGIIVCVINMMILPFVGEDFVFNIRLELVALIPYLIKMNKIKTAWANGIPG